MDSYTLPTSLTIGEVAYPINYGWKNVIDILCNFNDPDYDNVTAVAMMLKKLFPDWQKIPRKHTREAIEKACDFLDCGKRQEEKNRPRVMDWQQDGEIIIPEVNRIAGQEIRLNPDIHWWTFYGWYMNISDGLFATILRIRNKKARGKKLEKWEEEFYQENRNLIDLKNQESDEVRREKENIMKWLNGGG